MAASRVPKSLGVFSKISFYLSVLFLCTFFYFGYFYYIDNFGVNYYSAVYLDNGDVYFGKLYGLRGEYATLFDVYYFKDSSFIKQNDVTLSSDPGGGGFSLIRMGSEVHGPENSIKISSKHIIFVEKLSQGSKVLEAISSHRTEKVN